MEARRGHGAREESSWQKMCSPDLTHFLRHRLDIAKLRISASRFYKRLRSRKDRAQRPGV